MRVRGQFLFVMVAGLLAGQDKDISGIISEIFKGRPVIAVPDFRGSGDAQSVMGAFNDTLWAELQGSGVLEMREKSFYPLDVPQQPQDFKPRTLAEWAGPPVSANYVVFGYTAVQDGRLVLRGWLYNLGTSGQLIGKLYFGSADAAGAKKVAREFAIDILQQLGVKSLNGTKIYFVSDRSGHTEIWSMDYDGSNQVQFTHNNSITKNPAVSADGKMVAFTTYAQGNPKVMIRSVETGKSLPFRNPESSLVANPEFTRDGKHILFAASLDGWTQVCIADLDGRNMRQLSHVRAIETSPRVNPKTNEDVLFISGRSGAQQLWRMNIDGGDEEMLTTGEGEVANPSWRPDGQMIAFAWTRGYEIGDFNLFMMDIAKRKPIQITQGGINENPWWAPDGLHIVFSSKRSGSAQIYSMLLDGTDLRQLTKTGNNIQPVWSSGIE
jgi:TolB protein